jgi:hypothetical protein
MISAALVITLAVDARPRITLCRGSFVAIHSSRTRDRMNTS